MKISFEESIRKALDKVVPELADQDYGTYDQLNSAITKELMSTVSARAKRAEVLYLTPDRMREISERTGYSVQYLERMWSDAWLNNSVVMILMQDIEIKIKEDQE